MSVTVKKDVRYVVELSEKQASALQALTAIVSSKNDGGLTEISYTLADALANEGSECQHYATADEHGVVHIQEDK